MNNNELVSVIIPVYNAGQTIIETIKSVQSQSYQTWEIIAVDDGSTDNSFEVLKTIEDDRIQIYSQENQGVASARNNGIRHAKGKFMAFLDADDLWHSDKLAVSLEYLDRYDASLFYSNMLSFAGRVEDAELTIYREPFDIDDDFLRLLVYDYIPTLTVVLKKSVLEQVGLFDEQLKGTEDWDLWIRIAGSYKICFSELALSYYRHSPNGLSKNRDRHLKEELKVIRKHAFVSENIIKKSALWVWRRKSLSNHIKQRRLLGAVKDYLFMLYLLPGKKENLPFLK